MNDQIDENHPRTQEWAKYAAAYLLKYLLTFEALNFALKLSILLFWLFNMLVQQLSPRWSIQAVLDSSSLIRDLNF